MTYFVFLAGRAGTAELLDEWVELTGYGGVDTSATDGMYDISYADRFDLAYGEGAYDAVADVAGDVGAWVGDAAGDVFGGLKWVAVLGVAVLGLVVIARR